MKGKIIKLEWEPGFNIKSSNGYKKKDIQDALKTADIVKSHGFGNYTAIKYSTYMATIEYENGSIGHYEVKDEIKKAFNISRLTVKVRDNIESLIPIDIEKTKGGIKILNKLN